MTRANKKLYDPKAPDWAYELLEQVFEGKLLPFLCYKVQGKRGAGGVAYLNSNTISLVVGSQANESFIKSLVLHECAHILTSEGHTNFFWSTYWDLIKTHCEPKDYQRILDGECTYKAGAIVPARKAGFNIPKELEVFYHCVRRQEYYKQSYLPLKSFKKGTSYEEFYELFQPVHEKIYSKQLTLGL